MIHSIQIYLTTDEVEALQYIKENGPMPKVSFNQIMATLILDEEAKLRKRGKHGAKNILHKILQKKQIRNTLPNKKHRN
ncbi:hypothetical protein [Sigmofec virus UA08Rod_4967]|uniref:Uncharacterized protein n=1 Tax=Sigmofec virus UA08Rod_4967 TaxID=2929413 RepID=A0A976N101_9VIRU|nr:hypothetical protein [Sigmofec virus UA08Rod_4967]